MMTRHRVLPRALTAVALLAVLSVFVTNTPKESAEAAPAAVNGSGSSYVALAMQQWVADGQTNGLRVNYTPTGSPQGLTAFGQNLIDFAGTEAEFSALQAGLDPARGYQYVPDVAGAVAMMYNVQDSAGRKVDYLHLSRSTVARIFMGDISRWSDPAITADNKGLQLPDQPITVVYRAGQSGTTALFYDFVANIEPQIFARWAAAHQLPTNVRIIQLDSSPNFAPKTQAFQGSDQIAQFIASGNGLWSIGYDEFGYAQTYGAPAAWVENGGGQWVQPYAPNISAALEAAQLRDDLSQDLRGVYTTANDGAYPISAYSYLVTQCAPAGDRPTCKGDYANPGIDETLATWMRYIACDGQVHMADIGYSPLPPNLSQEIANSIGRMQGGAPEQLNAGNCANPRFTGNLGGAGPADPLANVDFIGGAQDSSSSNGSSNVAGGSESAAGATGGAGEVGATKSAGGGSGNWRKIAPVAYERASSSASVDLPLLLLLAVIAIPPFVIGRRRRRRNAGPDRSVTAGAPPSSSSPPPDR